MLLHCCCYYCCTALVDKKLMVGLTIMFRWDCGWSVGTIKRRHTKGTTYNYFVLYEEAGGTTTQYRHGLRQANYYNDDNDDGLWFVIKKEEP